mmetsp:Transcript_75497/g.151758  ORF Transcript_75497/g.151758 Transcript_75497/m.151758 type:complete len:282 (-) Transcript_75497:199-1044(-)
MGCSASVNGGYSDRFSLPNPEHGAILEELMVHLHVSIKVVDKFYKHFKAADHNHSNSLSKEDIWLYCDMEPTTFIATSFDALGGDDERLRFLEAFCIVYNVATLDGEGLWRFIFKLMDADQSGWLSYQQLEGLVEFVYGKYVSKAEVRKSYKSTNQSEIKAAKKVMESFDSSRDNSVTLDEFLQNCRKHPKLLGPAVALQEGIRKHFGGKSMWKQETNNQLKRMAGGQKKGKSVAEIVIEIAAKTDSFNLGGPKVHSGLAGFKGNGDQTQQIDAYTHRRMS